MLSKKFFWFCFVVGLRRPSVKRAAKAGRPERPGEAQRKRLCESSWKASEWQHRQSGPRPGRFSKRVKFWFLVVCALVHFAKHFLIVTKTLVSAWLMESSFQLSYFLTLSSKHSVPGEASTPLVRSSERLAAKRRAHDGGSLETLYFTPMMPRGKARNTTNQDHKLESSITSLGELTLDSARKPSSSVQRRRTTQVINITMTKVRGKVNIVHVIALS